MTSLHATTILLVLLPPVLSLLYSIAVHAFLSIFHERSFWRIKFWLPVVVSMVLLALKGGGDDGLTLFTSEIFTSLVNGMIGKECSSANNGNDNEGNGECRLLEDSASYLQILSEMFVSIASLVISTRLILATRRREVDGPIPPLPDEINTVMQGGNCSTYNKVVSVQEKVVLITGSNCGIGLETARQLYERGAIVILACRSRERATEAMADIDPSFTQSATTDVTNPYQRQRMHFLPLDLTSNKSIRNAAQTFLAMDMPLHVLINNAGVMRQKREETVDGLEMTMAANVS
ncbi:predicted protein [Thalassiosira pseudonana CCMP1335]|uniref:Uncharacterized protein n=1 Tax=Thalassiosira pseudonana TaxID=35128 RepID=B8CG01_THAPS|nr:predicted protein [Thalassiosira pseudonana CCMP1335]EED87880.1 predicted protein [Thalassiosira pseudonana CCMP1335]